MMRDTSGAVDRLSVHVLGDIGAQRGSRHLAVTSSAERRVLARLVASSGAPVTTSGLIDTLWPDDPPATAKASLQNHIHRLRSNLGVEAIVSTGSGYRLAVPDLDIDIGRLGLIVKTFGRDGDPELRLQTIDTARSLSRGQPFAEFSDEPWAIPAAHRAKEHQHLLCELRVDALMQLGRFAESIPEAQQLCHEEPLRESSALLLMHALDVASRVADALRVAAAFRLRTVEATGLEPSSRMFDFERTLLVRGPGDGRSEPDRTVRRPPRPLRPIVGRSRDHAAVRTLVSANPVVTLTGPGGVGKTRLALSVADELADQFDHGVYFVDLGSVTNPAQVSEAFASACGAAVGFAGALEAVVHLLEGHHSLVVVDCCERVVERVASVVATLVQKCPAIRILATSRERLQIDAEEIYDVQTLGADSVELFATRAASARPGFRLDGHVLPIVEEICVAVDGLPLGIELAAALISAFDPATILLGLKEPLDFLVGEQRSGPERHRGLRSVVDWSWKSLTPLEQKLLQRSSVFVAPFTLPAITDVVCDEQLPAAAVPSSLASLVRKSLVSATIDTGVMRYRMLDTVRSFAMDQLTSADEAGSTQLALVRWAIGVIDTIDHLCHSPAEAEGASLRRRETANIGAALDWAVDHTHTDLAMRFLPAIVGAGIPGFGGRLKRIELLPGWESTANAPYLTQAKTLNIVDFDGVVRSAVAGDITALPNFLKARSHMVAVQACGLYRADPDRHIHRLRELSADADPRVRWAHALGEYWALPPGDVVARQWALRAMDIARLAGIPGLEAIAEYLSLQIQINDETLPVYRRLRATFVELDRGLFVTLCDAAIEFGDPSGRSVQRWFDETARAVETTPMFVRNFGHHRAHLIAKLGRQDAAAMVFGSLDRMRADGEAVTLFGDEAFRNHTIDAHPDAFARGRLLSVEQTAALVVNELKRMADIDSGG